MSPKPIPQDRLDHLVEYVDRLEKEMRLTNWTIWVQDVYSEDDDVEAYVEIAREKEYVHLHVSESFFDLDPGDKRQVMTHEMVHLLIHPLDVHFCLATNRMSDSDPFWREKLETTVDNIARRIAPHMPEWEEPEPELTWRQRIAIW